ncbi:hypothetical protein E2562_014578, partial [Oryza meyeriana var. granulata]
PCLADKASNSEPLRQDVQHAGAQFVTQKLKCIGRCITPHECQSWMLIAHSIAPNVPTSPCSSPPVAFIPAVSNSAYPLLPGSLVALRLMLSSELHMG